MYIWSENQHLPVFVLEYISMADVQTSEKKDRFIITLLTEP